MINRTLAFSLTAAVLATLIGCQRATTPPATSDDVARGETPAAEYKAPAPAPAPPPKVVRTVPAGTVLSIELLDHVASDTSTAGDRFRARVAEDIRAGGVVAIPAGSSVAGVVTEAVGLKKIGGTPKLRLEFTDLQLASSRDADLHASYSATGKSETKKDAGTIAGATAGGAILGRIIGHQKDNDARGTTIGAVVGAGVGTAIAAKTKGQEIVLPSGHVIDIVLDEPLQVTTRG